MSAGDKDYVQTCFKHKVIPTIFGTPAFHQIEDLKRKIVANAASVPTTLGGGAHGHMGLTMTDAEYANISATPYVRPPLPAPVVFPTPCTYIQGELLCSAHKTTMDAYRTTVDVERALLGQIQGAFEEEYLSEIINADSHVLEGPISDIWDYLYDKYGQVDSEVLANRTADLRDTHLNLASSFATFYHDLESLKKMSELGGLNYTDDFIIDIACTVFMKTGQLETALLNWHAKVEAEKTWANLKSHFNESCKALKKVRGANLDQTVFQQANMMAQTRHQEHAAVLAQIQNTLHEMHAAANDSPSAVPSSTGTLSTPSLDPILESINSVSSTNAELLKIITKLQKDVKDLKSNSTKGNGGGNASGNEGGGGGSGTCPDGTPSWHKCNNTSHYCWTHGACAHDGSACKNKKPGHKDAATFANKMGGSIAYCNVLENDPN